MTVTPGPAASASARTAGPRRTVASVPANAPTADGAVDHLPGDRLARFQVEGGSQGEGMLGVDLHGAALTADALQAGRVMIFEMVAHIYAIT